METSKGIRAEDFYQILFSGLTLFLFYQFLEKIISQVFVLNFSTAGPNITVILILFVGTGFLYTFGLKNFWPHSNKFILMLMVATFISSIMIILPILIIPLLGAILGLFSLTPIIVHFISKLQEKFVLSASFSILFNISVRALFDTAPIFSLLLSIIAFYLILLSWFAIWFLKREKIDTLTANVPKLIGVTPLISFIYIEIMLLGSPSLLSTWFPRNYVLVTLAVGLGLVSGSDVVLKEIIRKKTITYWKLLGYMFLYVISLIVVLWVENEFISVIAIFSLQMSAVIQLHKGTTIANENYPISSFGLKMGLFQLLCVILMVLQLFSGNWAFLPSFLEIIVKGNAALYLFILGILLPISTAANYNWPRQQKGVTT